MSAILGQFSNTIRNAVQTPALDGEINQVCTQEYQTGEETGEVFQNLENSLAQSVPQEREAQLGSRFNEVIPIIVQYWPSEIPVPPICKEFVEGCYGEDVRRVINFCLNTDPVQRFEEFGFDLKQFEINREGEGADVIHSNKFQENEKLQKMLQFAEKTRNCFSEQEKELVVGAITVGRAARIFQIASELSLIRVFQDGANGAPNLTGDREQDVRILRKWLKDDGRKITEINASGRGLLCFPRELFFCSCLRRLILSNNPIQSLPRKIDRFQHLEELDAWETRISNFPNNLNRERIPSLRRVPRFVCWPYTDCSSS